MIVRKTETADIAQVNALYEAARAYFKQMGIPQWQLSYPGIPDIAGDIEQGTGYVIEHEGHILGAACLAVMDDPTYRVIADGSWLNDERYCVMHRIAMDPASKGAGLGALLVAKAAAIARENGLTDVRADTHEINRSMRRFLEKNGFVHCGTIFLADGAPRVAYHKVLKKETD